MPPFQGFSHLEIAKRDALLHAAGANDAHGIRRTSKDKRKAVMALLTDEEWSGREIVRCFDLTTPQRNYVVPMPQAV